MSHLQMAEVLQTIHKIPSLPVVIVELLASMNQEDTDIEALGTKIGQDPALTAKTLRLANSSFYGMSHQITTTHQAISILGFRTIRCLATTTGLMAAVPGGSNAAFDLLEFWRHGIAAAVCARELAHNVGCDPDHAYTAALLHDVGRLVLATQFPTQYAAAMEYQRAQACPLLDAEQSILGVDHTTVGHALARHWNFPSEFQEAVARHHTQRMPHEDALITAVRAANILAHGLQDAHDDEGQMALALAAISLDVGIEGTQWNATLQKIMHAFEGATLALSL